MSAQPTEFFVPLNQRDLVFLDLETSGLDPDDHEIIEFAAVRLRPDLTVERSALEHRCVMRHPERAEPKALQVNRYSDAEWIDAVDVRVALIDFAKMLGADGETILVGVNPSFDWSFVFAAAKRERIVIPRTKYLIDIASIAFPLLVRGIVEKLGMETLCLRYGITNRGSHRAMADVRRSIDLYRALLGMKKP